MPMKVRDAGGVLRTITRMRFRDGGTLRNIVRMKVMDGAELRTVATFATPLSLSANNVNSVGSDSNVRSGSSTASPTGGLGPYSYAWTKLSGADLLVSGGSTATANFQSSELVADSFETASYRCTCTDSSGQTATADISVQFGFINTFS